MSLLFFCGLWGAKISTPLLTHALAKWECPKKPVGGSRSPWAGSAGQDTHPTDLVLPLVEEEEVDWKGPGQLGLSDGSVLKDVKVFFYN